MRNKKAQLSTQLIVFFSVSILAAILGIAATVLWLYDISSKECKSNNDCGEGKYCGVDHACHIIPIIQESSDVSVIQNNYGIAGFTLGISIIISSLIIKRKWTKKRN